MERQGVPEAGTHAKVVLQCAGPPRVSEQRPEMYLMEQTAFHLEVALRLEAFIALDNKTWEAFRWDCIMLMILIFTILATPFEALGDPGLWLFPGLGAVATLRIA